jgi:ERF superfamily
MSTKVLAALVKARKDIGAAKKGAVNPHFRSKYADLGSVMEAVKEPLEGQGLAFVQDIENGCVVTVIMHESGECLRLAPFPIMATKQDAQGMGSGLTYARRYSLQTALGVPAEDDDGNAASKPTVISPVKAAMQGVQVDEAKVSKVASALIDFHAASATEDVDYQTYELVESLDNDTKLAVWAALAEHSKVRSWIKKVSEAHRKAA